MAHATESHHEVRPRQEEDLLPPRLILYVILGALGFSLVLSFVSYRIQGVREHGLRPSGVFLERNLEPIVERSKVYQVLLTSRGEGQILEIQGRQSLEHFGWVREPGGLVRVPIDVAMDLAVEEASR